MAAMSMLMNSWSPNPSDFRYDQRHYKKDSRFVMDLYTLTYDSHESLDCHGVPNNQLDKGCFIYQKPSTYEDNDIIHRFEDMKIVNEFGVNSNDEHLLKTHSYNLKKNDREEIRNRLVGSYQTYNNRKSTKKSSLESRLQNGSSLQLCFMNDPSSDLELPVNENNIVRHTQINSTTDLKQGLIQAKTRARAHMISDHRNCVISAVIKDSLSKVGAKLDNDRKRVSRHFLMRLNLAQLQVIVNDLHSFIEYLNESLVNLLLERDELHMAKDSMLVDIEDLKHVARVLY
ncbi:schwannomin-interacting protein 1-like isoform X2 [Daktulosphaira vitifoliae]|uniref:schwannomin-interacting protein 1-like isoform X2 n=1 Tax=Daktulosphaira vitifoliae TaxID=58002 RepID=UPI0021AA0A28|nr:schwannomin-interacting protein 1-like isoform X2 [Daktulosphaira vitifoliae]